MGKAIPFVAVAERVVVEMISTTDLVVAAREEKEQEHLEKFK